MEFQEDPVLHDEPLNMPWVNESRAVIGEGPMIYVRDGKVVKIDT